MTDSNRTFKERLIFELNYHGISFSEFADKIEISKNTLNMYLYRNSIPSADIAVKMAKALNTTVEYLITGENEPTIDSITTNKIKHQKNEIMNIIDSLNSQQLNYLIQILTAYKDAVTQN